MTFPCAFAEGESLYEKCHTKEYFCCQKNGKESAVVEHEYIWGTYNYEAAQNYCAKLGASISVETEEFDQVPVKELFDPLEDLNENFLEID